jgi:glycosyltransferase involved in cell wall biosynthesis
VSKIARITVYTPTFNRAYTLEKGYKALLRQTSKDFEWLIIDDGSTDNTKSLVDSWIAEGKIKIRYIYQENSGVHIARNNAINNITTELNVCVDSDDYLVNDAIESVLKLWDEKGGANYAGIIGWDIFEDGCIVGKPFPEGLDSSTLFDLYELYKIPGDKKMFYRTDIVKRFPSPQFDGEKYFPNKYKYTLTDEVAPCLLLHKPLCVVEYLPDGITADLFNRYLKNPKGFIFYREFLMKKSKTLLNRFRQAIHYVAMCRLIGRKNYIKNSDYPVYVSLAQPFGFILLQYIKYKAKRKNTGK